MRHAALHALAQRIEKIEFILPEDHPFAEYAKPFGMDKHVRYRRHSGAMVRLINLKTTFAKLSDEIGGRMDGRGTISLRTNLDSVNLGWKGGKISVLPGEGGPTARMPQWALAQLLYGYRDTGAMAAEGIVRSSARGLALLKEMFPVGPHHFFALDQF